MQSKRKNTKYSYLSFYPIVFLVLALWILYRSLFSFPVWFDEIIGKAVFFAVPIWLFVTISGLPDISDTLGLKKMKTGMMKGLAMGGIFGFIASLIAILQKGSVRPVNLFYADRFWWEFLLSLMTAFWETLFFFSFIHIVVKRKYKKWSVLQRILFVAIIFLVFHFPNILLRFSFIEVLPMSILLFMFALGQAFLFEAEENAYTLILTHAIWGMVLLVNF